MIDVDTWVYSKLSTDATLLALLPHGAADIYPARQEVISTFPSVYYREENQPSREYLDDLPTTVESVMVVDVYTDNASPTPFAEAICAIFNRNFWATDVNQSVQDPTPNVRHRHLVFSRDLAPSDLN